jgi:hemerythrin-like domain-containing protein
MCDYCGCRLRPAIDELSEEHERLLDLVYGLRRKAEAGDHAQVAATLERDLAPLLRHHADKEERGLFTQLRAAWQADDRLDALVTEHRDLERLLAGVIAGGQDWTRLLLRLADELTEHIFDEETDLFPYALYELTPAQWDEVEAVHAGGGGQLAAATRR